MPKLFKYVQCATDFFSGETSLMEHNVKATLVMASSRSAGREISLTFRFEVVNVGQTSEVLGG
jgi:hypothetical protein